MATTDPVENPQQPGATLTASAETRRSELFEATEQELFALISLTARSRREVASRLDERLTPVAVPVLGVVLKTKRITQSEICDHLLMDKATLSRVVTKLEELGLVARQVDEHDRRVSHLLPTQLATERWKAWITTWREDLRGRINGWNDEDLMTLVTLLGRLNSDIRTL